MVVLKVAQSVDWMAAYSVDLMVGVKACSLVVLKVS